MEVTHTKTYTCYECRQIFSKKYNLYRHKRTVHTGENIVCKLCDVSFNRRDNYLRHIQMHKSQQKGGGSTKVIANTKKELDTCNFKTLNGTVKTHTIEAKGLNKFDPMTFLKSKYDNVKDIIKRKIKERGGLKWYLFMKIKINRRKVEAIEAAEPHFRGKNTDQFKIGGYRCRIEGIYQKDIYSSCIEYQRQGSKWTVNKVVDLTIHKARYRPLKGSSYIPLPIKLRSKHAIVNVKNKDNKCFMWSILAAMYPGKHDGERVWKYKEHTSGLNFDNIMFPVKIIPKFEKQNEISITVIGFHKGEVFPTHISKHRYKQYVNLFMISDNNKSHFCWIRNLHQLLGDQKSAEYKHFYCPYCLQKIELPTADNKWLHYKDIRKQLKVPYVIYADFECLQEPIVDSNECDQKTKKTNKHIPCGFAYKVVHVGLIPETSNEPVVYRDADTVDKFVECMVKEQDNIEQHCEPMIMTGSDWKSFKKATMCHICKNKTSRP